MPTWATESLVGTGIPHQAAEVVLPASLVERWPRSWVTTAPGVAIVRSAGSVGYVFLVTCGACGGIGDERQFTGGLGSPGTADREPVSCCAHPGQIKVTRLGALVAPPAVGLSEGLMETMTRVIRSMGEMTAMVRAAAAVDWSVLQAVAEGGTEELDRPVGRGELARAWIDAPLPILTRDQGMYDQDDTVCWRCDAADTDTVVGLCKPCHLDLTTNDKENPDAQ